MRRLFGLLSAAALIRLMIVLRGGQYFDWDEHRYGFATLMLARLREGDYNGMLDVLFRYPEHPGFKVVGLLPAIFHLAAGAGAQHPISDMRFPTGEWAPAFILALASVCSIGLTYAVARRGGAGRDEGLFAAFLMFASAAPNMHAPHFFPYDTSLAIFLLALWVSMDERLICSLTAGVLSGAAYSIYEGYWLLVIAVAGVQISWRHLPFAKVARRGALFVAGALVVPAALVAASAYRGRSLIAETLRFSETVTHGDFSRGWLLPWEYFWHAERGLLVVVLVGGAMAVSNARLRRAPIWAVVAAGIYLGLVAGSDLFHRFVVYDRLARQMWPFLCLAAAAGFAALDGGRWIAGRRAPWLYGAVTAMFVFNIWPLVTLRYPREIVGDVIAEYGHANVRLDTSLLNTVDATSGIFLPVENVESTQPARYVLLNARDIWIEGEAGEKPAFTGAVIRTWKHPRQLPAMQYHGYTAAQREFLRRTDCSIRLIDTAVR